MFAGRIGWSLKESRSRGRKPLCGFSEMIRDAMADDPVAACITQHVLCKRDERHPVPIDTAAASQVA